MEKPRGAHISVEGLTKSPADLRALVDAVHPERAAQVGAEYTAAVTQSLVTLVMALPQRFGVAVPQYTGFNLGRQLGGLAQHFNDDASIVIPPLAEIVSPHGRPNISNSAIGPYNRLVRKMAILDRVVRVADDQGATVNEVHFRLAEIRTRASALLAELIAESTRDEHDILPGGLTSGDEAIVVETSGPWPLHIQAAIVGFTETYARITATRWPIDGSR